MIHAQGIFQDFIQYRYQLNSRFSLAIVLSEFLSPLVYSPCSNGSPVSDIAPIIYYHEYETISECAELPSSPGPSTPFGLSPTCNSYTDSSHAYKWTNPLIIPSKTYIMLVGLSSWTLVATSRIPLPEGSPTTGSTLCAQMYAT